MKSARHLLCFALLAFGLEAAEVTSAPKLSMSNLSGVPTPLEEYGLSIGDITVTRVINPLGQLKQGSSVMLARRIQNIINPWAELAPGTALIVDGKKAVIRQIQPDIAPKDRKDNLRVVITAEEITGTKMDLAWRQELHNLNSPVRAEARKQAVTRVKEDLRVGSHLILNNQRMVVTERTLTYTKDSTLDRDLVLSIKYQAFSGGEGELLGEPSTSEVVAASAWNFWDKNKSGTPFANNTVQLLTWTLKNRDEEIDNIPRITVLHRAHGNIYNLQLKDEHVTAEAKFEQDGHAHKHTFKWAQEKDNRGNSYWRMDMETWIDEFVELFLVNDTNIDFKVTPDVLLAANRKAIDETVKAGQLTEEAAKRKHEALNTASLQQSKKNNINALPLSPGNVDTDSLNNQIRSLKVIMESDASEAIKLDAKRKAVIYLARFYEHSAVSHKALAGEYLARAEIQLNRARVLELHAWANTNKLNKIRTELSRRGVKLPALDKPAAGQPGDTNVKQELITNLDMELKAFDLRIQDEYKGGSPPLDSPTLRSEHDDFLRKTTRQKTVADELREKAKDHRIKAEKLQVNIHQDYNYSLQYWTEYIHRTEGLARDKAPLSESGVTGNAPPPDPYIPEILLRQAWIYRQMGQPDRALSSYYAVLSAATQQKVDNLTRFSRIVLVARSQIANTYNEDADPNELKNYISAIDFYKRLLKSNQEELNTDLMELNLLRCIFKAGENARLKIRMLKLEQIRLEIKPSPKIKNVAAELNRIKSESEKLNETRLTLWKKMEEHATDFIQRTSESSTIISHNHTGEVRYYQIMAYNALGHYQHVWQSMEVLLENESTPDDQRRAWAGARVRVVIDIANRLFDNGKVLMENNLIRMVAVLANDGSTHEIPEWRHNLESALVYYKWALQNDPSYRSQILIRQQIGFCYHRLGNTKGAREQYKFILDLCEMHPSDVTDYPTIKMIRALTRFRVKFLDSDINRKKTNKTPQNPPS